MSTPRLPDSPRAARPIKILLVDDHAIMRQGLRTLLEGFDQVTVVGEANSVASAVAETARLTPDVVILDIRLSDGSGIDACRELHQREAHPRVLVLTSYADDETLFEAIAAGADGYLLKEVDSDGLVRAIEDVASGKSVLDPAVTRRVLNRVKAPSSAALAANDMLAGLSPQERRILALVAQGKTNKEVAVEMELSDKTVKNYLSNALDKLKVSRRSQAIALYVRSCR